MFAVQITTRDFPISSALETLIRKRAEKLNRYCKRISSCRIVAEVPQKHKRQGKLHNIRIDVTVPGKELVVTRKQNEDIHIAIRDAFHAVERILEEHSRKRKGHVKTHHDMVHGHVTRLVEEEGFGFIEDVNGNEYYFSVTNIAYPSSKKVLVGDHVQFVYEAQGDGRHAQHIIREKNFHREAA